MRKRRGFALCEEKAGFIITHAHAHISVINDAQKKKFRVSSGNKWDFSIYLVVSKVSGHKELVDFSADVHPNKE